MRALLLAAAMVSLCCACLGQETNAGARAAHRFPKFVDPLVTNTPWQVFLPSGMAAPEALRRKAAARGRIDSLNATPHSSAGILAGDIRQAERLIDPLHYPEWAMRQWEALASRLFPSNSSVTVTNGGG